MIQLGEEKMIYDGFLIKNLTSILKHLSRLSQKHLRYTATLAGLTITTALADIVETMNLEINRLSRRIENLSRRNQSHLESLHEKNTELIDKQAELEMMINSLVEDIFLKRIEDYVPQIRSICVYELGRWMETHPRQFLNDENLEFIACLVCDKDYSVREQSLEALIPLYENDKIARELKLFTQKYKDRLISLTCDKRPFNQVIAIKLVTVMFRSYRDLFTREDVYMVFRMVLNSNRRVAVTAGEFLNDVIERVDEENNSGSLKRAGFNVRWLRYIVTSFIKLGHLDLVPYLVDALIAKFEIIKDWEIMIHILTQTDDLLTPIEQDVLTEMMLWSARLATTGEYPWDRAVDNMVPSSEEIKQMKEDKSNMTKHLMPVIPILLAQFKNNVNCLINLMEIPQYFDLETYTSEMEDLHLKKLLSALEDIVRETTNANLLRKCSKTLHCLYKRASIAAECDAVGYTIVKECAYIYMEPSLTWQSIVDGQMDPKDANKEDYLLIVNCLKKIAIFYSLHNVNYLNIYDDLLDEFQVYRDGVIHRNLPIEGSIYCLISCGAYLSWELKALKELNDMVLDCMVRAKVLKLKLKEYFEICKDIVQNVIYDDLHKAALCSICDMAANFHRELGNHRNQIIHDLVLHLSSDDITLINKYTEEYVFIKHWKVELLMQGANKKCEIERNQVRIV
ncbi:cohesin subunit SA-2-like [Ctenocephalides felis]|uniref:cohesin subunit SA-2-like n=1 Tax=Ctenocephalides felis TaxID=7515 RepID=UPI000E6E4190|nr:cohesin subunit SA-2-like [Ctenocephalides felis]